MEFNLCRKEIADIRVRRAITNSIDVLFFIDNLL